MSIASEEADFVELWLTRRKEEQQTFSGQAPFANATRRHLFKGLVGRTLCEHGHGQCRLGNEECFTRECVKRVSRRLLQSLLKGMNAVKCVKPWAIQKSYQ